MRTSSMMHRAAVLCALTSITLAPGCTAVLGVEDGYVLGTPGTDAAAETGAGGTAGAAGDSGVDAAGKRGNGGDGSP